MLASTAVLEDPIICDAIRHQRSKRLMMSYTLKINPRKNYALMARNNDEKHMIKIKKITLARTAQWSIK